MGAIWSGLGDILRAIIEFFYGLTNSYGLSIVLLTLLVRIILYPLNHKQLVSMQAMQKIQPRLKVIQEKYADDKQKMTEETMRLYQENKVNPAAGCLPLLVQLPVLILLFNILRTYDFTGAATFFGITLGSSTTAGLAQAVGVEALENGTHSLFAVLLGILKNPMGLGQVSLYLPNLILLLAIAFLTWAQSNLSSGSNPQMSTMNTIMPVFMGFICLSMPGGVMIYWGLSTLVGVAQQYYVTQKAKDELSVKPVLHKNKPGKTEDEDAE